MSVRSRTRLCVFQLCAFFGEEGESLEKLRRLLARKVCMQLILIDYLFTCPPLPSSQLEPSRAGTKLSLFPQLLE